MHASMSMFMQFTVHVPPISASTVWLLGYYCSSVFEMQNDLSRHVKSVCVFYIFVQCILGLPVSNIIRTHSYDVKYEIRNKPVDFEKASSECMLGEFELARKQNNDTWIGFTQAISPILPPNTKVWIDHTVEYTPWLSEKGCYESRAQFAADKHQSNWDENHRETCSQHCIKFEYFSLKGEECSCWITLKSLTKVDRNMCNISCPGEENEVCGGKDVISIFKIEKNLRLEEDEGLCMTYKRSYSSKKTKQTWRNSPCWVLHDFICEVNGLYIIPPYKANWTAALSSCADNYNGSFIRDEENNVHLDSVITNGTTYWVGKFRDVYIKRGQGRMGSSERKCLIFVKESSDWINTEEKNCTQKHRPLCQKVVPVASSTYNKADNVPSTSIVQIVNYVLVAVAVVVIVVFAVLIFVRRRNKKAHVRLDQTDSPLLKKDREESPQLGSTRGREKFDQYVSPLLKKEKEEFPKQAATYGREKFPKTDRKGQALRQRIDFNSTV